MNQNASSGLVRAIRRWDLVAVAINGIIGAGIFGLPSKVFALIGPYSLVAFIACAFVVTLIIFCFAEVSSRFSETGGPYLYAREAFGPLVGFQVGWLIWLARLTAFAANCNLLVSYSASFWPGVTSEPWRASLIMGVVVLLTMVNILGVRDTAVFSNAFTVGKLLPIAFFIIVGLFFIDPQRYALSARPSYGEFSASVLLLIYAFTGFEMAVIPAGEIRDPQRNLPMAILTAIGVVATLYILIQVVCIGTLPTLATSEKPLADASRQFLGFPGAKIISAGALISITGNLIVLILSGSRLPFAMAERAELPRMFSLTHARFHTPHFAILLTGAIVLAMTVSGTFIYAATVSAIARLLAYAATCASLPLLRRKDHVLPASFKAPAGIAMSMAALGLAAWLLSNSTWREARDTAIAAAAGWIVYVIYQMSQRRANRSKASESL